MKLHNVGLASALCAGLALWTVSAFSSDPHASAPASKGASKPSASRILDTPGQGDSSAHKGAPAQAAAASDHGSGHAAHWSYRGQGGPDQWGDLKPDYHVCKAGKSQSPIDLTSGIDATLPEIRFDYRVAQLRIANNGHTIQLDFPKGSRMQSGGKTYELLQYHFHAPSEHLIDGKSYPLEVHLVHKNEAGDLAVVGVMFEPGEDNIALQEIWRHLPKQAGDPVAVADVAVNAYDLLPPDRRYHRYMGSLTTPPCSEGVNWHVMRTPLKASARQIKAFIDIAGENARPPQALNSRLLVTGN
jgi:carbonic anhydrase